VLNDKALVRVFMSEQAWMGRDLFWQAHSRCSEYERHQSTFCLASFVICRTRCTRMSQFEEQM